MAHGGPSRSSGISLMAEHGTFSVALPTEPLRCRSTEPLWSSSPRWTGPRRPRCATSSRTRSAPRSPTAARRPGPGCPPRACWRRRCTSRAAWCREAYAQIAAEGWIEIRRGAAPVVRAAPAAAPDTNGASPGVDSPARLDLTATAPDLSLFPRRAWSAALRRVVADMPDAALDYAGDPRGDAALRAELAAYLVRVRGLVATDVVLTNGYTQGLWLTCRALAARGATRVAVEDPSLDDAWATIRSAGLEVVGLPVDEHGVRARRPRRRRAPGHAGAPVPDRRRARAGAPAGAAGLGRDRDRGRLRLRVPLRPRAGRDAAAARARPRRLPRDRVQDARARRCGSAGSSRRRSCRRRSRASAGGSTPAATRSRRARTRGCWPPARSTGTCAGRGASTANAATGWSRRSPGTGVRGRRRGRRAAPAPTAPTRDGRARRGGAAGRAADQDPRPGELRPVAAVRPALVLGYGRLPLAAIDAAVDQLTAAL